MLDKKHPYPFHHPALAPLLPGASEVTLEQACHTVGSEEEEAFTHFLLQQDLAPLWAKCLETHNIPLPFSNVFRNTLHRARMEATGQYLLQHEYLGQTREILDDAGIPHAVFKGASTRERYFNDRALRPTVDQDVLINEENNVAGITAFQKAGYTFQGVPENISHECSLTKGKNSIDLHWDILRPGRTRNPMTKALLATRTKYGNHWTLDDSATLFILLVHPVFTKYLTTPHATLVRQLDLVYLLNQGSVDWSQVITWLEQAGLKTAAWLSLQWLGYLINGYPAEKALKTLQPGKLRRQYLLHWLRTNLSTQWMEKPSRVQLGFTLPAHDSLRDAMRASQIANKCKSEGPRLLSDLKTLINQKNIG